VPTLMTTSTTGHWIHNGPIGHQRTVGGPIRHAYLSLALLPHLLRQTLTGYPPL
jgi:hypothetical protein